MAIRTHLPTEKWNKENVTEFIMACREQKGIPMFKTQYANQSFKVENKPGVMAVCWGGEGPEISEMLTDVKQEDMELMKEETGDWRKLLDKYGSKKEKKEAKKGGVAVKSRRIPEVGPKAMYREAEKVGGFKVKR